MVVSLPHLVIEELGAYLECGRLEYAFLRVKCDACRHEKLVAFSCKRPRLLPELWRATHGRYRRPTTTGPTLPQPWSSALDSPYPLTETSPISFQSDVDDSIERGVSTVGRILPHVEVKVVDGDGRTSPVGVQGELLTRGYSVMQGYWGDVQATREAIVGGWMHTGDLATVDAEGYCRIVGRVKDMLVRGGGERLPGRDRGLPAHPSRHRRGAGLRRARREVRRGGLRLGGAAPGRSRTEEALQE